VRTNVTGDSTLDSDQLEAAVASWQAAMPADALTLSRRGDLVTFTACQASGGRAPGAEKFTSAYSILDNRMFTALDLADYGISTDSARCVADLFLTDPRTIAVDDAARTAGAAELTDEQSAVLEEAMGRSFAACGVDDPR
jgi:hypothetical protein